MGYRNWNMAYVPTGHNLKIRDTASHEYFGADFVKGEMNVALFRTDKGKLRAVWSSSDWEYYEFTKGQQICFEHTQSNAKKILTFVALIKPSDLYLMDDETLNEKAVHWTLK